MSDAPLELLTDSARSARFWGNVARAAANACWPWARAANGSGYGVHRCGAGGVSYTTMAHRVAWSLANGRAIPDGKVIDHICGMRLCCNPAHLRVVDQRTNVRASGKHLAGDAAVLRRGPRTIRLRGSRWMVIWREYLVDGGIRQCGRTFGSEVDALAFADA